MVPFRDSALQVVQTFVHLLEPKEKKIDVSNKKRFKDEFGEDPEDRPTNLIRPDDYQAIFSGNVDDHFRICKRAFLLISYRGSGFSYDQFHEKHFLLCFSLSTPVVVPFPVFVVM